MIRPSDSHFKLTPDLAAAASVSLLPLVYFLPAILRGAVLCPDDGTIFNTPLRVAAARITLEGHLPLRSEEHTSELQSRSDLVCRLLLEKKKKRKAHLDSIQR